jgi:hypothetical protein
MLRARRRNFGRLAVAQATVAAEQYAGTAVLKTLAAAGAIAERDAEGADRASLWRARRSWRTQRRGCRRLSKMLRNTVIRSFAGVVSELPCSRIVSPGSPYVHQDRPAQLARGAAEPTTVLADVRVGAPVLFTVNGLIARLKEGDAVSLMDPQTSKCVCWHRRIRPVCPYPVPEGFSQKRVCWRRKSAIDQTGIKMSLMRQGAERWRRLPAQLGVRDEAASPRSAMFART